MQKAIFVVTHTLLARHAVLQECLDSIGLVNWPVWLAVNGLTNSSHKAPFRTGYQGYPAVGIPYNGYEVGAIKAAFQATDYDEIFFLHDTCLVKDQEIFDIAFDSLEDGHGVAVAHGFLMLMGKYCRKWVERTTFPEIRSKRDAVMLGEFGWNAQYMAADRNYVVIPDPLNDGPAREEKWGRVNMVLENKWLKKWKGAWDLEMIKE